MKKFLVTIIIIGAIGVAGYYGFRWIKGIQEEKMAVLEDKIHYLKSETVPLKFKILEKDSSNIKFVIKFEDEDSIEFNRDTLILKGDELSFDFYVVPIHDNKNDKDLKVAFPWKVFTNKIAPKDGTILFDYYDDHGFPQVFSNSDIKDDTVYINRMSELFLKIKNEDTEDIKDIHGSMVQDVKNLNEFAVGHAYEIIIHTKGGIEIKEIR